MVTTGGTAQTVRAGRHTVEAHRPGKVLFPGVGLGGGRTAEHRRRRDRLGRLRAGGGSSEAEPRPRARRATARGKEAQE